MSIREAAREIAVIEPIAQKQAEQNVEDMRLAVLREKEPASELDRATNMRDSVNREGTVSALTERLANVTSGHITINHEPGASALNRLTAVADGINLELAKQRTNPTPIITSPVRNIDRGDIERSHDCHQRCWASLLLRRSETSVCFHLGGCAAGA